MKIFLIISFMLISLELSAEEEKDVRITFYHPVTNQCNTDPLLTADGSRIDLISLKNGNLRWIAVSRDFLINKKIKYGDKVYLSSQDCPEINGYWEVHDTMNKRFVNFVDILTLPGVIKKQGLWKGKIKIKKRKED